MCSCRLAFLTPSSPGDSAECRPVQLLHGVPETFLTCPLKLNHLNTCHFSWTFERFCLPYSLRKAFDFSAFVKIAVGRNNFTFPSRFILFKATRNSFSFSFFFSLLAKCVNMVVEFQWFGLL